MVHWVRTSIRDDVVAPLNQHLAMGHTRRRHESGQTPRPQTFVQLGQYGDGLPVVGTEFRGYRRCRGPIRRRAQRGPVRERGQAIHPARETTASQKLRPITNKSGCCWSRSPHVDQLKAGKWRAKRWWASLSACATSNDEACM